MAYTGGGFRSKTLDTKRNEKQKEEMAGPKTGFEALNLIKASDII